MSTPTKAAHDLHKDLALTVMNLDSAWLMYRFWERIENSDASSELRAESVARMQHFADAISEYEQTQASIMAEIEADPSVQARKLS